MLKKILIVFVFTIVSFNFLQAQSNYLFYRLKGCKSPYAVLLSNRGDVTKPVDTAYLQQSGGYAFTNIQNYPPGIYTVYFNDSVYTEVIFNNENIVLDADINNILMSIEVKQSIENSILFGYWKYAIEVKDTINMLTMNLQKVLQNTGGQENKATEKYRYKIDYLNNKLYNSILKSKELYPDAFAPKLLLAYQIPSYDRYLSVEDHVPYANEMEFYKHHFFDNIDFSDARLLNTKVLTVSISDYMTNFGNPASTSGYKFIIDKVMSLAKANEQVYHYCLNLFIRNFDNTIWEDVFVHIIDTYYRNSYVKNPALATYYFTKAEAIKKLKPGKVAPDFTLSDTAGNQITMHKVKAKAKMLIFYSSDCPHCEEAMPNLIKIYNQYKDSGVEFIGIAIDDDGDLWKKDIIKNNISWISLSDLKGMSSPLVDTYNIWMTPTMIILDSKNVIMKKPATEAEIHSTFLQLLYK